jgi:hypothetical protein
MARSKRRHIIDAVDGVQGVHPVRAVGRAWEAVRHSGTWPYLALLFLIVLPLLWMAAALAVRSGLLGLSGRPTDEQVKIFLTFIGGGLATAATVFTALLTREHNARERRRLRLETVVKSLEALPPNAQSRVGGVLSTMVLLGQQRIALRVLEPAWKDRAVDDGTATWLIGEVLTGGSAHSGYLDGDLTNEAAINEAAALLATHADHLTDTNLYYFPGHFMTRWRTEKELPHSAKDNLVLAMGRMLVSRKKEWWCPEGDLPAWPTNVLMECAETETDREVRDSAAVLVAALHDCFPAGAHGCFTPARWAPVLARADAAVRRESVPADYRTLAARIRRDWHAAEAGTVIRPEAQADGVPSR